MRIYPAIDLLDGRAVRLVRGERANATVYHDRPLELVDGWTTSGAARLHLVDLNGAFGEPRQPSLITAIVERSSLPVEVGGGIRDRASIEAVLGAGAAFVVVGTAAVRDPAEIEHACRDHPGRVIIAVDARDGVVAIDGWTRSGQITALELAQRAVGWGAAEVLYTDIARDGLRSGPNVEATARLAAAVGCPVIASGGVGSLGDVRALRDAGIAAVVIGRALYEGSFTVADAVAVARGDA